MRNHLLQKPRLAYWSSVINLVEETGRVRFFTVCSICWTYEEDGVAGSTARSKVLSSPEIKGFYHQAAAPYSKIQYGIYTVYMRPMEIYANIGLTIHLFRLLACLFPGGFSGICLTPVAHDDYGNITGCVGTLTCISSKPYRCLNPYYATACAAFVWIKTFRCSSPQLAGQLSSSLSYTQHDLHNTQQSIVRMYTHMTRYPQLSVACRETEACFFEPKK